MSEMKNTFDQNIDQDPADLLDVKELWRILNSYKVSIISILALGVVFSYFSTLTTRPVYEATAVLMIDNQNVNSSAYVLDFSVTNSAQRLQNEIEILSSYNLNDAVVQSLIDDGSFKRLDLFGTRYTQKRYRLKKYLMEWIGSRSDTVSLDQADQLPLRNDIVNKLRGDSEISVVPDTDVLTIAVRSTNYSESILLADRISKIYRDLDLEDGRGELHFVLTFLDSQITKYKERLELIENQLEQFKTEQNIYSIDGSTSLLLKEMSNYESIYFTNIAEMEVSTNRLNYLKDQLTESEKALMAEIVDTNNPMIVALRLKIAEMEAHKIQQVIDEGWGENSLQTRDFSRRIDEMKKELIKTTESLILSGWSEGDPFGASQEIFNRISREQVEVHSLKSRAAEYKILVDEMSARLEMLPTQTLKYARYVRELELNENLYVTMKQKYEESRITQAGQRGKVRILDSALTAEKVKPNKRKNLILGIFLGLGLGVGSAFIRELLDTTVKAVEQLERKGLTVLGIIPEMHQKVGKLSTNSTKGPSKGGLDFQRRLITHEYPKSPISESYRSLRTNISYSSSSDRKIRSILVSSPQPGEGKSTTVANIAITFAQMRKRVLLIDADLRKPVQHNVFGHSKGPGLAEYLVGDINEIDQLIRKTKIDNLFIVTAGVPPPNPSELLGSDRMGRLVDKLEQEWDIVLFDSPPIVAVTDSSMISSEIDALIMVVKAGQTDRSAVDRALDTVKNVKSPLIGVVLNAANPESLSGKYSYYYSYYQYYYDSGDDKERRTASNRFSRILNYFRLN